MSANVARIRCKSREIVHKFSQWGRSWSRVERNANKDEARSGLADIATQDFARLTLHSDANRAAADLAISHEILGCNGGVDRQVKALAAEWA